GTGPAGPGRPDRAAGGIRRVWAQLGPGGADWRVMSSATESTDQRWVRVGHSAAEDAHVAGKIAASEALGGPKPQLLVVWASFGYDLPAMLDGVNDVADGVPVIGCSTAGEIAPVQGAGRQVVVA